MHNRALRKDTAHIHFPFSILHFQLLSRRRKNHPRKSRVVFYLYHCSVSSHERGQLLNPLQREQRERHRLHGDGHQLHRVIVSRCAVGMQYTAASAAMNHCPLTVFANPDTDGVHDAAAVSGTVARLMGIPPEKSILFVLLGGGLWVQPTSRSAYRIQFTVFLQKAKLL